MPEIMIPLIGTKELRCSARSPEETIAEVKKAKKFTGKLTSPIGTMIEIPRAALTADEVAEVADFFSFGTNDLTQMTFGYSRDDVNTFLPDYLAEGASCPKSTRSSRSTDGRRPAGRDGLREGPRERAKKGLKVGICGEHGGDPASSRSATRSAWTT
jgi:pyruvate,orthophosphate dikinase